MFSVCDEMQSAYEDIDNLRQLLDNLIVLSLNQEDIIKKTNVIEKNDPEFVKNMIQQKNILDNSLMIQDSLFALSKRVIQIKSIVNKEIEEMNINLRVISFPSMELFENQDDKYNTFTALKNQKGTKISFTETQEMVVFGY